MESGVEVSAVEGDDLEALRTKVVVERSTQESNTRKESSLDKISAWIVTKRNDTSPFSAMSELGPIRMVEDSMVVTPEKM